jgi:Domain of unknown function (DUF4124)
MRRILTFTALFLITASALATGEIYRWKDDNGTWHYSDQPHPGAELVRRASNATDDTSSESPPAPAPAALTADDSSSLPVTSEVASQVRQEAASAKAEQCKQAEDAYQKAVQARRIYKTDEKGNRVYFSDAEIDAARLRARAARDLACGPGN